MVDNDDINQRRLRRIACEHHCTIPDVNVALDAHPIKTEREKYLSRLLALELVELDELGEVFREKAIRESDVAAGSLLTKIHERRATLLGLNAPSASAVTVIEHESAPKMNSTERSSAAIDRIRSLPKASSDRRGAGGFRARAWRARGRSGGAFAPASRRELPH